VTTTTRPAPEPADTGPASSNRIRVRMPRRPRMVVLTVHIVASVALLGVSAAVVAIGVLADGMSDPTSVRSAGDIMSTFAMAFGIPLSLVSLVTGVVLGLATRWGVVRHGWVIAKIVLLAAVMVNGALLLGSAETTVADTGAVPGRLVPAAIFNVVALTVATGLSVFKPVPSKRRAARQG